MIAIDEDNTPYLRDLETRDRVQTSRQFAVQLSPGRIAFANFAVYRNGINAETSPPTDEQISAAIRDLMMLTIGRRLISLESTFTGHPTRVLEMELPQHRELYIHCCIVSHSADSAGIHAPTDDEIHQLFAFLTRCHPLT